ncbi:cysteine--tRNA ligase, cytoplasmic-like isoform X2 [Acropora millepora]|uniref:cysteine--tRNA ligase, cytoplasmic-like isoform X2 n=1 Tax=Acropora millepora TaxID=45264 RepID=UPI001CF37CC0|nr:cysteine--tRNA ligase, cytoplasmic-like isoform X2 [Acropora millepora]
MWACALMACLKIIFRARRNHLLEKYIEENNSPGKILEDVNSALKSYSVKMENTTDEDKKNMFCRIIEKVKSSVSRLKHLQASKSDSDSMKSALKELLDDASDPLSTWLDTKILPADCLTRIMQYIPECATFFQKIIENGCAYEANGSVYFDTIKFGSSGKHAYARLVPEAVGDMEALAEGEGELSQRTGDKKSGRDFALWKASKPGEPAWDSPWGKCHFGKLH